MKSLTITIDGYVATGKWTIAVWLARKLWYTYLDTGAMYRAVTRYALIHDLMDADEQTKTQMMNQIDITFQYNAKTDHDDVYLNGQNIENEIRQTSLTSLMKPIVISPAVRTALWNLQRIIWSQWWIVVDGRDMGTVVFPDADLKIFLVGNIDIRVQRRYKQLIEEWKNVALSDIYHDIALRDDTDYLWVNAINYQASDAIIIDTSLLTMYEQIDMVYQLAIKKL
jgi:CMP/dCMP kinase